MIKTKKGLKITALGVLAVFLGAGITGCVSNKKYNDDMSVQKDNTLEAEKQVVSLTTQISTQTEAIEKLQTAQKQLVDMLKTRPTTEQITEIKGKLDDVNDKLDVKNQLLNETFWRIILVYQKEQLKE